MNCPDAKSWNLLSMNLLDESDAESLRQHSRECEQCHAARQEAAQQNSELLAAFQAFDRNHVQQRDQLMAMLPQTAPCARKASGIAPLRQWLEEVAMTLQQHKLRWAAVVLVPAACILVGFLLMSGEKIAFAEVLEKIRQAKTMVCDFVTTTTIVKGRLPDQLTPIMEKPLRGTISMSIGGDTRAVLIEQELLGRKYRILYLGEKAYLSDGNTVRVLTSADAKQQRPTEDLLELLLSVRESPDRNLGEQTINGRRAVGYEIAGWKLGLYGTRPTQGSPTPSDSDISFQIWIDAEEDLPVCLEMMQNTVWHDATVALHHEWNNIRWNVPLNPANFQPPSTQVLAKTETTRLPAIDETTFVDGMRAWLESKDKAQAGIDLMKKKVEERGEELPAMMNWLFQQAVLDAGFPERLDTSWLVGTFSARATLANLADTLPKQQPISPDLNQSEREKLVSARAQEAASAGAQVATAAMLKATAVAAFYGRLANEQRNPEYFGSTVQPGDAKAVLLRWKLDDGRYRVIYGDLRAATLDTAN